MAGDSSGANRPCPPGTAGGCFLSDLTWLANRRHGACTFSAATDRGQAYRPRPLDRTVTAVGGEERVDAGAFDFVELADELFGDGFESRDL